GGAPISIIRQYIEQQETPSELKNRALYPRPEGRGFMVLWIKRTKIGVNNYQCNRCNRLLMNQNSNPYRPLSNQ
ncbi:hypothetical protein ETG66_04535, partial [Proteus mirabilis]|nr:hypothetical protein [Proteus mirabilis]